MIDCHSHLIFGIDDGSKTIEESIKMIEIYIQNGYKGAICTSHLYPDRYKYELDTYKENFNILSFYLKKNNIDFEIFTGNEIHISAEPIEKVMSNKALTLANSKYLLIELPFNREITNIKEYCYNIVLNGFIPILAHIERYNIFRNDLNLARELSDVGVLFQINLSSLKDKKSEIYNLTKQLLDNKLISIAATDSHSSTWRSPDVRAYLDELKLIVNEEYFEEITRINPIRIVKNDLIKVNYIREEKNIQKTNNNFIGKVLNLVGKGRE